MHTGLVMNGTTSQAAPNATITVGQAVSPYGNPEPQVIVQMPRGTTYRKIHAALHMLAAEVELATPDFEHWSVQTDVMHDDRARVYLELVDADAPEAARGLALLRRLFA